MATLTIKGYQTYCKCEMCNKPLKLGIVTDEKGVIGSDCFIASITSNRKRFTNNGKPTSEMVKQYAMIATKGFDYALTRYGLRPSAFVFEQA